MRDSELEGRKEKKSYPYTSFVSNFNNNLEKLSIIFSKIFKKKVEFEIIKAQFPFQDPNFIVQILGYNANNYKFRQMLKILIPRSVIKNPSKELTSYTLAYGAKGMQVNEQPLFKVQ